MGSRVTPTREGPLEDPGEGTTSSSHLTPWPEMSGHNLRKIKEGLQGLGTTAPILKALTPHPGSWQEQEP